MGPAAAPAPRDLLRAPAVPLFSALTTTRAWRSGAHQGMSAPAPSATERLVGIEVERSAPCATSAACGAAPPHVGGEGAIIAGSG